MAKQVGRTGGRTPRPAGTASILGMFYELLVTMHSWRTAAGESEVGNPTNSSAVCSLTNGKALMAKKRELIDTRSDKGFVRRDKAGQLSESDDVGRSLAVDRRQHAKTEVKSGQGDKGDQRRPKARSETKSTTTWVYTSSCSRAGQRKGKCLAQAVAHTSFYWVRLSELADPAFPGRQIQNIPPR